MATHLQRIGLGRENPDDRILADPSVRAAFDRLADELGEDRAGVRAHAHECLAEMSASHQPAAMKSWSRIGEWLLRAYDIEVDDAAIKRLVQLDRSHSLVWLPSHRSYLDAWSGPNALAQNGLPTTYGFGGANLNFFPFGTLAKRTGMIFIRRSTGDDPVYRLTLRTYIAHLVEAKANFGWAIEGGRTRTGKLRPPRYGILKYVVEATDAVAARADDREPDEVLLVPMSIVYDQLHELKSMAAEARGATKRPEDIRWLIKFARSQSKRMGKGYLDIGEPIPLHERLTELRKANPEGPVVERIALEVCHRINKITPITLTGVVTLALLAEDRALTIDEVRSTIEPMARYVANRSYPVAGGADLTDPEAIERTLQDLTKSGVVTACDTGTDPVWSIEAGQHLIAAFYRNTAVHLFVNRAIGELALLAALENPSDDLRVDAWHHALALRDLMKFEFFFADRAEFAEELRTELSLIDPTWNADAIDELGNATMDAALVRQVLQNTRPHMARLVLRPFLEAYLVVAERLAARGSTPVTDEDELLKECLGVGQQWVLQRKLASEESVSLELFRPAVQVAKHRRLLVDTATADETDDLATRRHGLATEVRTALRRVEQVASMSMNKPPSNPGARA